MPYFTKFPQILYDFFTADNQRKFFLLCDITTNVRFQKDIIQNLTQYENYDMLDGETPEIVSEKFYGSPQYHWIIMILNEKYDYVEDFPLAIPELEEYIAAKYTDPFGIHHWQDPVTGYIVDSNFPNAVSVTNTDYETQQNEVKRRLKIIAPELLQFVLKQFDSLV